MAIPLAILIASIMVFGNLSERHELSSLKSAGVSLIRIMRYSIVIALCTAVFSYFTSNFLEPAAKFEFYSIFRSIQKQKPALSLDEGIFNKDFKDYVIRIGEKGTDGRTIKDVMIYDHTSIDRRIVNVITAEDGKMYSTDDGFIMELRDGYQYKELPPKAKKGKKNTKTNPLMRTEFKTITKVFDLSQFELDDDLNLGSRNKHEMLNRNQLIDEIDSLRVKIVANKEKLAYDYSGFVSGIDIPNRIQKERNLEEEPEEDEPLSQRMIQSRVKNGISLTSPKKIDPNRNKKVATVKKAPPSVYSLKLKNEEGIDTSSSFYEAIDPVRQVDVLEAGMKQSKAFNTSYTQVNSGNFSYNRQINFYTLKLHQKFSWAVICIVFLFIGAPLGSIIRKGGYGYPLLISIIFYVVFVISSIMGEKLIKNNTISPILAAWIPVLLLSPVAIFFSYKALRDEKLDLLSGLARLWPFGK